MEIYCEEVKQFVRRKGTLRRNLEKLYGLVWGQCSTCLQMYIWGLTSYQAKSKVFDVVWLLQELKKATSVIDDKANTYVTMHDAISALYQIKQGDKKRMIAIYQDSSPT